MSPFIFILPLALVVSIQFDDKSGGMVVRGVIGSWSRSGGVRDEAGGDVMALGGWE